MVLKEVPASSCEDDAADVLTVRERGVRFRQILPEAPMTAIVERSAAIHPLEPLSEEEFRTAARILRDARHLAGKRVVCSTALHEPDRAAMATGMPPREAFMTVLDR